MNEIIQKLIDVRRHCILFIVVFILFILTNIAIGIIAYTELRADRKLQCLEAKISDIIYLQNAPITIAPLSC